MVQLYEPYHEIYFDRRHPQMTYYKTKDTAVTFYRALFTISSSSSQYKSSFVDFWNIILVKWLIYPAFVNVMSWKFIYVSMDQKP